MSDKQKYPGPLYAAAGFGDLAAEKLRELPDRVSGLQSWAREEFSGGREKAQADLADLGGKVGAGLANWRHRVQDIAATDRTQLRADARRRAGELADEAGRRLVTAQVRAAEAYQDLVARGSTLLDADATTAADTPDEIAEHAAPVPESESAPAPKKMAKKATRPAVRKSADK
ncbi:hypothetical protein AB0I55_30980 [Actinocatenispora sera]|uniref:Uncharacterized protein n=1 Tax=Actinocatenispora sera TaxID=390989 RepID=A0A810KTV2_9ACTN|nr:hypothetical protein [Actinocatenispora sera]BCJ26570.1 hypothetical protein Asera_06780 [Actinocatenispora sera]